MEEYDALDIIKILKAASELGLQGLINHLQSFLIKNKTNWIEQNFNLIYQTSFEHDSFLELQKVCTDMFTDEPDRIFKSADFTSIPEKPLVALIQNGKFQMSAVQVWEYVLKWGLAQNPELPSDPASFSKDDFNTLKKTLQQCIPFIRFYNLSSKEFLDKVLPYEEILPKELYKDLLKSFLSHSPDIRLSDKSKPRVSNIDSKIITFQHAELISKWIERLEITDKMKNSYEFKLLFRGSRDGLTPEKFHEICDNQSRTVTVIKAKDNNGILGGYNPIEWKSKCGYSATKDSFIFSFKNSDRIENYILSRVKYEKRAIYNDPDSGPIFGFGDLVSLSLRFIINFGYDSRCIKDSYEKRIRETENGFSTEECEVFQIIQNQ